MKALALILLVALCGCSVTPPASRDTTGVCKSTVYRCETLNKEAVARLFDQMPRSRDSR